METSRIKTFFIWLLLAVNIFLFTLVVPNELQRRREASDALDKLQSLLSKYGITMETDIIPELPDVYRLRLDNGEKAELSSVKGVLGQLYVEEESGGLRRVYRSSLGSAEFSIGGEFHISLKELPNMFATGDGGKGEVSRLLDKLGFSLYGGLERPEAGAGQSFSGLQALLGEPVYSSGISCRVTEGLELEGIWYLGTAVRLSDTPCIGPLTALVEFLNSQEELGWLCSEISAIERGYTQDESPSLSSISLSPVWRIQTDTGIFEVDGYGKGVRTV